MNNRLKEFIQYKTGGRQTEFCALVGWTPPYLAKLLKGVNFGLSPVVTLLSVFPELDARWLLLGTGTMLGQEAQAAVRRELFDNLSAVLDLERFMPVMSPDELRQYERLVTAGGKPDFSPGTVSEWQRRLADREAALAARFAAANNSKGERQCKQKTAK